MMNNLFHKVLYKCIRVSRDIVDVEYHTITFIFRIQLLKKYWNVINDMKSFYQLYIKIQVFFTSVFAKNCFLFYLLLHFNIFKIDTSSIAKYFSRKFIEHETAILLKNRLRQ